MPERAEEPRDEGTDADPEVVCPVDADADVGKITSAWVHWYNTDRIMHRTGRRPPAEADARY